MSLKKLLCLDFQNESCQNMSKIPAQGDAQELSAIVFEEKTTNEKPYWKIWEVILCFAAVYVISSCSSMLLYAAGFAETISGIIASFIQEGLSIALPFMVVYNIYGYDKAALGFKRVENKQIICKALIRGIAYYFLATVILMLIILFYPYEIETQTTILPILSADSIPVLLLLLLIAGIIAPIAEEIFFRGFLYAAVRYHFPIIPAAVISGILFGLVHMDLLRLIPISFLGFLLCVFYEKYKNIYLNIAVHIGFNCTSLFLLLLI